MSCSRGSSVKINGKLRGWINDMNNSGAVIKYFTSPGHTTQNYFNSSRYTCGISGGKTRGRRNRRRNRRSRRN
jgi:hypothetical protein